MSIGILALQGGYTAHQQRLAELQASSVLVTTPEALSAVDGLIMPGGESTTMLKLMQGTNFFAAIQDFHQQGKPILGTCAGAILLATHTTPDQPCLGLMDIDIERNAYGRQLDSHIGTGVWLADSSACDIMFIRAPKIRRMGDGVVPLARYDNAVVCVQQGNCIAATYHPELSADTRVHQVFLQICYNTL